MPYLIMLAFVVAALSASHLVVVRAGVRIGL